MTAQMTTIIFTTVFFFASCLTNNSTDNQQIIKTQRDTVIKNEKNFVSSDSILQTGWYYIVDTDNGFKRQLDKDTTHFFIDPNPIVTAKNFVKMEIYTSKSGHLGLSIKLDNEGTKSWSIATEKAIGQELAFILDNKLIQTPTVMGQITGGITAINNDNFSKEELEKIIAIISKENK